MSKVAIALGAEVDIASGRELSDAKNDILTALNGKPYRVNVRRLSGSTALSTVAASSFAVVDMGICPSGKVWDIRSATASAPQNTGTPAGNPMNANTVLGGVSVSLYIARTPPSPAAWSIDALAYIFPTVSTFPYTATFGKGQCPAQQGEHLYLWFYMNNANANSFNLIGAATVLEIDDVNETRDALL